MSKVYNTPKIATIRPFGNGFTGTPIIASDELNRQKGEISLNDPEGMPSGFAHDACHNHPAQSMRSYFPAWDYAINRGFASGSGTGTNHRYGYQIRKIYTTAWPMRDTIWKAPNRDSILSALIFWSALQETRIPYQYGWDELLDSWHALLMSKIISAFMSVDEKERARALIGLSRWLSSSSQYSPGTIGGIKVDGTTLHHGGFYPAYTTGVPAMVGQLIVLTGHTQYVPTQEARQVLKSALISMCNYSNSREWGIGISGRHPFGGGMKGDDVKAFAYLALSGDLLGEGNTFDHYSAADYPRFCNKDTPGAEYFKKKGIIPVKAPQGFFIYNYGSTGIFRCNDWMVTLKGYTTDIWGAEIYKKDNQYGRYQSYGPVQIMGYPSRIASGHDENGWDQNHLPGTTTIHLPFGLLDSPLPGTTMAHSKKNFSGSSALEGKNGIFAMELMERNLKNFTLDFVARRSVSCFDNRTIYLGIGISNSNASFPTEATLSQGTFQKGEIDIHVDGGLRNEAFHQALNDKKCHYIQDGYNNYYFINGSDVQIQIAHQVSRHEKNRIGTQGAFASVYINHGVLPQNAQYEYMILVQPIPEELKAVRRKALYRILHKDGTAHAVADNQTGITAYTALETYSPTKDEISLSIPAETMVMQEQAGPKPLPNACDPNLNISEKTHTTRKPSRPIEKKLTLKGKWRSTAPSSKITVHSNQTETVFIVTCQHGQPVELTLSRKQTFNG